MSRSILEAVVVITLLLSVAVFFWAIFTHVYVTHLCFTRLRKAHIKEYEHLGEPHVFFSNSIGTALAFSAFVSSGRYRELNDRELEDLVHRRRNLGRLAFAGAAVLFGVLAVLGFSSISDMT